MGAQIFRARKNSRENRAIFAKGTAKIRDSRENSRFSRVFTVAKIRGSSRENFAVFAGKCENFAKIYKFPSRKNRPIFSRGIV